MIEVLEQYRQMVYGIDHEIEIDEWIQHGDFMLLISLRASLEDSMTEDDSLLSKHIAEVLEIDQEFKMILTEDQFEQLDSEAPDRDISEWWG